MLRVVRATPAKLQLVAGLILCVGLWAAVNWIYHAVHKPTELLFPVSNTLNKTPPETWREYESHFRRYATPVVAPELLAAIAQVESSGTAVTLTLSSATCPVSKPVNDNTFDPPNVKSVE